MNQRIKESWMEALRNGSIQKILINGAPILSLSDKDFVMAK